MLLLTLRNYARCPKDARIKAATSLLERILTFMKLVADIALSLRIFCRKKALLVGDRSLCLSRWRLKGFRADLRLARLAKTLCVGLVRVCRRIRTMINANARTH